MNGLPPASGVNPPADRRSFLRNSLLLAGAGYASLHSVPASAEEKPR